MIKKQGNKNKLKNMNFKKILGLFLVFSMFTALGTSTTIDSTSITPEFPATGEQVILNLQASDSANGIVEAGFVARDPDGDKVNEGSGGYSSPYPENIDVDFFTTPQVTG